MFHNVWTFALRCSQSSWAQVVALMKRLHVNSHSRKLSLTWPPEEQGRTWVEACLRWVVAAECVEKTVIYRSRYPTATLNLTEILSNAIFKESLGNTGIRALLEIWFKVSIGNSMKELHLFIVVRFCFKRVLFGVSPHCERSVLHPSNMIGVKCSSRKTPDLCIKYRGG